MPITKGRKRALDRARDPDAPPPSLGKQVCDWMREYLVHGPGAVQGSPYLLHDDVELFTWQAYELDATHSDGIVRRRYAETVFTGAKGMAKSEHQGALCCVEGLGPVMFDGWDANGDPVGIARLRSRIDVYASSIDQTGNTYTNVAFMLWQDDTDGEASDALRRDYPGIDIGNTPESSTRIILPENRGQVTPMAGRARSKEGGIPTTFAALEEPHTWTLQAGHDLYAVVRRQIRKVPAPGGWMCHATNMYGPGEGSVLEAVDKDRKSASDLLWFQRSGNPDVIKANVPLSELSDKVLLGELAAAYGSATYVDLRGVLAEIRRSSSDDAASRRFFFNIASTTSGKWMKAHDWDSAKRDVSLKQGDVVALGFDGSRKRDATALIACRLSDRSLHVLCVWERDLHKKEWSVSTDEVDAEVADARRTYDVVRFYADPPQWQTDVERWAKDFGDTDTEDGRQVPIVVEWWTNRPRQMALALERFMADIAIEPPVTIHGGEDVLRRHILNAIKLESRFGVLISKARDEEFIDAAVAAVMAHEAACDAVADGCIGTPNKESIYENQGITWLD